MLLISQKFGLFIPDLFDCHHNSAFVYVGLQFYTHFSLILFLFQLLINPQIKEFEVNPTIKQSSETDQRVDLVKLGHILLVGEKAVNMGVLLEDNDHGFIVELSNQSKIMGSWEDDDAGLKLHLFVFCGGVLVGHQSGRLQKSVGLAQACGYKYPILMFFGCFSRQQQKQFLSVRVKYCFQNGECILFRIDAIDFPMLNVGVRELSVGDDVIDDNIFGCGYEDCRYAEADEFVDPSWSREMDCCSFLYQHYIAITL